MTKAQLLAVNSTAELVRVGGAWEILGLPVRSLAAGSRCWGCPVPEAEPEIAYAPIDKRGYPYAGGIALRDCQAL